MEPARLVRSSLLVMLLAEPCLAHESIPVAAAPSSTAAVSDGPLDTSGPMEGRATSLGVALPRAHQNVTARIGATVVRIDAVIGEPVAKGDVLVATNIPAFAMTEREVEAALAEADATVRLARSVLMRAAERLSTAVRLADGVSTVELGERRRSVLEAAISLARSRAEYARRQAALDRVVIERASLTLRAPVDGIVSAVPVTIGSRVDVDDTVARVVSEAVFVRFAAPGDVDVRPGDRVSIRLDSAEGQSELEAIVAHVSPTIDLGGLRLVETDIIASAGAGEIGGRCRVTLLTER